VVSTRVSAEAAESPGPGLADSEARMKKGQCIAALPSHLPGIRGFRVSLRSSPEGAGAGGIGTGQP